MPQEALPTSSPTKIEALQFALMQGSGMPPINVIAYFYPDLSDSPAELKRELDRWVRSHVVQVAILAQMGKSWQDMTLDERIQFAVDKHYSEMAYFLYSNNYSQLVGAERQKADTCRQALEAKLAGVAGKLGPIETFWSDVKSGKVKLAGLPA